MKHLSCSVDEIQRLQQFLESKELTALLNSKTVLVQIYSSKLDQEWIKQLQTLILQYFPSAYIVGASTVGEIAFGKTYIQSTVIGFSFFESSSISIFTKECKKGKELETGKALSQKISQIQQRVAGVLLLSTPLSIEVSHLLKGLEVDKLPYPLFGGGAGDYALMQESLIFSSSWFSKSGAIVVVFQGDDLIIESYSYLGWRPLSKKMTITKTKGMLVKTIDNRPAFEIYEKYLGLPKDENFFLNVLEFPLLVQREGKTLARVPVFVDEKGAIQFVADIHEGEVFQIGYGDPSLIISDSSKMHTLIQNFGAQAVFLYTCGCRRFLMQDEVELETAPFEKFAPTFGFYTYGEFFGTLCDVELLNSTMVVVGFKEGNNKQNTPSSLSSKNEIVRPSDPYLYQHSRIISRLVHFVQSVTNEVIEKNEKIEVVNKQLSRLLEERENLLKEIQHRVKNNFHSIIGILSLGKMKNNIQNSQYDETINRITTMSQIHEELYHSSNIGYVNTQKYLLSIIKKVSTIFDTIELQTDIEKHQIDFETATVLGTIINELVTNSFKHNIEQTSLKITITFQRVNDKYLFLYCDDGKGFDSNSVQKGLGLSLIAKFANKLQDAHFNYDSKIKGVCFKLSFTPNPKSTHSQNE